MEFLESVKYRAKKSQFEANKLMRVNRVQREINTLKRRAQRAKLTLGSTAYDLFQKEELTEPKLITICEDVKALENEIIQKENEIAQIKQEIMLPDEPGITQESIVGTAHSQLDSISSGYKVASPAAAVAILFFFMPWVFASCNGVGVGAFNGWQLATGPSIQTAFGVEKLPGTPALFLILLAGFGVLALAYRSWRHGKIENLDSIGVIGLGILPLALLLFLSSTRGEEAARKGITIEYMYGLWGIILGYIGVVAGGIINWRDKSKLKNQAISQNEH